MTMPQTKTPAMRALKMRPKLSQICTIKSAIAAFAFALAFFCLTQSYVSPPQVFELMRTASPLLVERDLTMDIAAHALSNVAPASERPQLALTDHPRAFGEGKGAFGPRSSLKRPLDQSWQSTG